MIDVLILELEGVLVDTRAARRTALRQSLADERIALGEDECATASDGRVVDDAIAIALHGRAHPADATTVALLAHRAARLFSARLSQGITLNEGARDFIARMHGRARLALVTRARREDAELTLGLAGLEFAFDAVVCADDVLEAKPSPEGYRLALDRLARRRPLAVARAVALEDARAGIAAATAAGLRCVAVGALAAHDAMEADGYLASLAGVTIESIDAAAGRGRERV